MNFYKNKLFLHILPLLIAIFISFIGLISTSSKFKHKKYFWSEKVGESFFIDNKSCELYNVYAGIGISSEKAKNSFTKDNIGKFIKCEGQTQSSLELSEKKLLLKLK